MATISNGEIASSVRSKINEAINKIDGATPFTNNIISTGNIELTATTTQSKNIEIGKGRTDNGYSYIDLIGDATYSDFGTRLIRFNNGPNSESRLGHRGTGYLNLLAEDNGKIGFWVQGQQRLGVNEYVNRVNIPNSPLTGDWTTAALIVESGASGNVGISFHNSGSNAPILRAERGANDTLDCVNLTQSAFGVFRAAAFSVVSDYRLKENLVPLENATARLKQLPVYQFNFKEDSMSYQEGRTVDGFIAHEVQEVVPEAATGYKDQVDAEGNPVYQGIDQSKLVPLLTAALQEALAKIEALEARVAALEV
jgi:hypothetical protein